MEELSAVKCFANRKKSQENAHSQPCRWLSWPHLSSLQLDAWIPPRTVNLTPHPDCGHCHQGPSGPAGLATLPNDFTRWSSCARRLCQRKWVPTALGKRTSINQVKIQCWLIYPCKSFMFWSQQGAHCLTCGQSPFLSWLACSEGLQEPRHPIGQKPNGEPNASSRALRHRQEATKQWEIPPLAAKTALWPLLGLVRVPPPLEGTSAWTAAASRWTWQWVIQVGVDAVKELSRLWIPAFGWC